MSSLPNFKSTPICPETLFKERKLLQYTTGARGPGSNRAALEPSHWLSGKLLKQSPNLTQMPSCPSSTMWNTVIVFSVTTPASQSCKHISCFLLIHWLPSMSSFKDGPALNHARHSQSGNVCTLSRSCSHPDRQIRWNVGEHATHSPREQWNSKREFHYTPV